VTGIFPGRQSELVNLPRPLWGDGVSEKNMKKFANSVTKFLKSEDGPTAVEYAVMLALIVIVCLTAIQAVGTNASAKFQKISDELAK